MATRAKKNAVDHVALGDKGQFRCTHCGRTYQAFETGKPIEMWALLALMKGFSEEHRRCPKPAEERCIFCHSPEHGWEDHVARTTARPEDWPDSGDTGISSKAIYNHMMGLPHDTSWGPHPPADPSDFGRCYRLLHAPWATGWRERIMEMGAYPGWAGLVAIWDELEALYLEEKPSGTCPKLFSRMRS